MNDVDTVKHQDNDRFLAPLEDSHSPSTFASIIFRTWGIKVTSITWAVITVIAGFLFGGYAGLVCVIIAGMYIYVVCYQAWKSERLRSDSLHLELTSPANFQIKERLQAALDKITIQEEQIEYYEQRLAPKLVVDPSSIKCELVRYPFLHTVEYCYVARFVIQNTGEMSAFRVRPILVSFGIVPDVLNGTPLQRANEFQDQRSGFTINGGDQVTIDIAIQKSESFAKQEQWARFRLAAPNHVNTSLGSKEIRGLKIRVTAEDHPPIDFRVDLFYIDVQSVSGTQTKILKCLDCRASDKDHNEATEFIS